MECSAPRHAVSAGAGLRRIEPLTVIPERSEDVVSRTSCPLSSTQFCSQRVSRVPETQAAPRPNPNMPAGVKAAEAQNSPREPSIVSRSSPSSA